MHGSFPVRDDVTVHTGHSGRVQQDGGEAVLRRLQAVIRCPQQSLLHAGTSDIICAISLMLHNFGVMDLLHKEWSQNVSKAPTGPQNVRQTPIGQYYPHLTVM